MASSPITSISSCVQIEALLNQPLYQFFSWIQLAIILTIFVLILNLARQYMANKITIHGNLMILICNLIFLYFVNALFYGALIVRYKFLFYTYSSNCKLLMTPVWLAFFLASPPYLYFVANPCIHFFITTERCRATLFARHYENGGFYFGWICAAISWFIALFCLLCIILTDLSDDAFSQPLGLVSLTSQNNAQGIIYLHYVTLFLLIATAISDYWIKTMNNKQLNRSAEFSNYSLSKNYQIRENLLTMRLILPLDISYAILFGLFLLIGLTIRYFRPQMTKEVYVSIYSSAITLLLLHSAITLAIYNKFIKYASPNYRQKNVRVKVKPLQQLTDDYFKQLENQWKSIQPN